MTELHEALQGAKIREDIYILRRLHHASDEEVLPAARPSAPPPAPPPPPSRGPEVAASTSARGEAPTLSPRATKPGGTRSGTQGLLTYALPTSPTAGPQDLPSLIRWFLTHDALIPNNLEILEAAHRSLGGAEDGTSYERHLGRTIADDLRIYNSRELLEQHLTLLTTVYARTLQGLRTRASQLPSFRSPADLPEPERREMWELCFTLGLTAARLRVEGWIYRLTHGELPTVETVAIKRRAGVRGRGASRGSR